MSTTLRTMEHSHLTIQPLLINATGNAPHVKSAHVTDSVLQVLNPANIALITITVSLLYWHFSDSIRSHWVDYYHTHIYLVWHISRFPQHNGRYMRLNERMGPKPHGQFSNEGASPLFGQEFGQNFLDAGRSVSIEVNGMLNQCIVLVANNDTLPPQAVPVYHTQSGPLVPVICDPYTKGDTRQGCGEGQVALSNATEEWKKYVCQVSAAGIYTTAGRLTPDMYDKMSSAVNVLYARERRHRKYTKRINKGYDESPLVGGRKL
ncbi:hypothetical protein CRYUN_Cryun31cG0106100 [Craigia yunnanensis]